METEKSSNKTLHSFTLPNCGTDTYYLSTDLRAYLGVQKGNLFKRFPHLWKRPLTPSEKTYLTQISICDRKTNSYVVKAADVHKVIQKKFPKFSLSSSNGNGKDDEEAKTDNHPNTRSELSLDDEVNSRPQCSSSTSAANTNVNSPARRLKALKFLITADDLKVPRSPLPTSGIKPIAFLYKNAEGSSTERYYTSNDVMHYTRRRFSLQAYPLLWRKHVLSSELVEFSVRLASDIKKPTMIFRASEVDEIVEGYDLKYSLPITAENRLMSYSLGDGNERYYMAHFLAQITKTKLHNYKLSKRLLDKSDKFQLRKQGVYGAGLKWVMLKVSEVEDLLAGNVEKYYIVPKPPSNRFKPMLSRSLLKKAKTAKLLSSKKTNNTAENTRDSDAREWQLQDESMAEDRADSHNGAEEEQTNTNREEPRTVDVETFKIDVIRDVIKMCVGVRVPLTIVENDMFRSICQTFINIGFDFAMNSRHKSVSVDAVLPSYREARTFVDNKMVSVRDALIAEAHSMAINGGIAASVYCNALSKSLNLVFTTIHFITTDWVLKIVPIAPIELSNAEEKDAGLEIKHQVLNALGIAPSSVPDVISTYEPPVNLKMEFGDEPTAKRARFGYISSTESRSSSSEMSETDPNIHFVMNNLLGSYFREMSRETKFSTSISITRCLARHIGVVKWKISSKGEKLILDPEQIQYMDERLFAPILQSLDALKNDNLPTISRILPTVRDWIRHFESIAKSEEGTGDTIRLFAEEMLNECQSMYDKHFSKDLFFFALILDPSQKNKIREYLPDKQKKNELTERFKAIVTSYRTLYGSTSNSSKSKVVDSFFDDDDLNQEDDIDKEVLSYLCTPSVEFTPNGVTESKMKSEADGYTNILEYWRRNEEKFPNCARLARKVLAIPATAERDSVLQLFSPPPMHNLDAETLRKESQPKNIVDLGVLLSMGV